MGTTKRRIDEVVQYLITWLCYGNEQAAKRVAYTADESQLAHYDVIIIPNGDLGERIVLPDMDRIVVEQPSKGKAIIRTDIIYNAFFFASRAEETYNTERDEHDRFAARFSLLGQKNRLQIPMLDEHARLVLKLLNLPLPQSGFGHIYLTHDIDSITQYRHLRGAIGGLKRGEKEAVLHSLCDIHRDPLYTFPWIIDQDKQIPNAEMIYFVKHTSGHGYDYPQYRLWGHDFKQLKRFLLWSGAKIGVHSSYYGDIPKVNETNLHRSHYLVGSFRMLRNLIKLGYTDDFTMGFADAAGFRLQTSRAIRWIDPETYHLTSLTLHPLIIMDTTLSNEKYMDLSEDEAYFLCERLINKVRMHHGDLCILWHNSSFTPDTYHQSLYEKVLSLL